MPDGQVRPVFEHREQNRSVLLGFAVFLGLVGLLVPPLDGVALKEILLVLACLCLWVAGFRVVYALHPTELTSGVHWFRWTLPKWVAPPSARGGLRELRGGRSLASERGTAWSVHAITSKSRLRLEYASEAAMQADVDAVRALCPEVALVRDEAEVPSDAETRPVLERCAHQRTEGLGAALGLGLYTPLALLLGAPNVALCLSGFACVCVCIAGFRVTYALRGTRLTETVRWYRWRFPGFVRATLPTGVGVLREVVVSRPYGKGWLVVRLFTSGGWCSPHYRHEASLQADLDELRALCPRVPIVMR